MYCRSASTEVREPGAVFNPFNVHCTEVIAMDAVYTYFENLASEVVPPKDGILSRTVFEDHRVKAVLFGIAANQELSEHASGRPAMIYFVQGEATVGLGDATHQAKGGTWIHLPPHLKHSIQAHAPTVMLLLLIKI